VKSVDQHLADLLSLARPLAPIELPLLDAQGSVLAEDVTAPLDLPQWDNSSMDGYAVRTTDFPSDIASGSSVTLRVVGEVAAGSATVPFVEPGTCVRIMTGAAFPSSADAVVPVEWTDGGTDVVSITQRPEPGQYIRLKGSDVTAGSVVLSKGMRLHSTHTGMAAAVGRERLLVRPHPRVVVISTGDELVEPGQKLEHGQIFDANSWMLTAAAREAGAIAYRVPFVPDDPERLTQVIEDQLVRADLVITTGGVSKGAYDIVKEVLSSIGDVTFEEVAMQPGKPQGFGTVGPDKTPIVTLPGNPASAYVSFEVFVRPMIRQMLGLERIERPVVRAVLKSDVTAPKGKRAFLRAELSVDEGRYVVEALAGQSSHLLGGLVQANALIIADEELEHLPAGMSVEVMQLVRHYS
jgi:molybdopterin molybdotransferase